MVYRLLESCICMTEDTPYAFLFDRMESCLGHTATYNQFLHYEGIQAYGASNWFSQVGGGENGHIISYIICDGQEYFTDTTNHLPLMDQKSIEKHLIFRNGSLERVRKTDEEEQIKRGKKRIVLYLKKNNSTAFFCAGL